MAESSPSSNPEVEPDPRGDSINLTSNGTEPHPLHHDSSTAKNEGNRRKEYDTPPESYAEAVSPMSSRKNGKLRAASLGLSPSAGREQRRKISEIVSNGNESSAFMPPGDGRVVGVHEPHPANHFPTIMETLSSFESEPEKTGGVSISHEGSKPGSTHVLASSELDSGSVAKNLATLKTSTDPRNTNPYAYRADEIGPAHGIRGLALLSDVLPPPGWKIGDAPIEPHKAEELYNASRMVAKASLTASCTKTTDLSDEEQEKLTAVRNKKWAADFKLDKLLLDERVKIYEEYVNREAERNQQVKALTDKYASAHGMGGLRRGPVVLEPPATTSIPYQNGDFHTKHPKTFLSDKIHVQSLGHPSNQGNNTARVSDSGCIINSTVLDPILATESYQTLSGRYQQKRAEILRENEKNEKMLSSFLAEHGRHFTQGPISPGLRSTGTGPTAAVLSSTQVANETLEVPTGDEIPRPPAYESPTRSRFPKSIAPSGYAALATQTPSMTPRLGMPFVPTQPYVGADGKTYQPKDFKDLIKEFHELNPLPQAKSDITNQAKEPSAAKKKRGPRKKPEKTGTWYEDQLGDLPTSRISQEAMQAGIDYGETGISTKTAAAMKAENEQSANSKKTPKKRGNKPVRDANGLYPISDQAAKALLALGLPDTSGGIIAERLKNPLPVSGKKTFRMPRAVASDDLSIGIQARGLASTANTGAESPEAHGDMEYSIDRDKRTSAAKQHNQREPGSLANQKTKRITHVEETEQSSEEIDDPRDGNFRAPTTPRKAKAGTRITSAGSKRKADGTPLSEKRVRVSMPSQDGAGNNDAAQSLSTCPPAQKFF